MLIGKRMDSHFGKKGFPIPVVTDCDSSTPRFAPFGMEHRQTTFFGMVISVRIFLKHVSYWDEKNLGIENNSSQSTSKRYMPYRIRYTWKWVLLVSEDSHIIINRQLLLPNFDSISLHPNNFYIYQHFIIEFLLPLKSNNNVMIDMTTDEMTSMMFHR